MPLRVAEEGSWIKAVNKCDECPFLYITSPNQKGESDLECGHHHIKGDKMVLKDCIPVWCPLPTPGGIIYAGVDIAKKGGDKSVIGGKICKKEPEKAGK